MSLDIKYFWSIFLRRSPYFLVIWSLCSAIALALASVLPPTYIGRAQLLLESRQISNNLLEPTIENNVREQFGLIRQRIVTRANLLDIAEELNVYPEDSPLDPDEKVRDMRQRSQLQMGGTGEGRIYYIYISFEGSRPEIVADVANKYVTLVMQESAESRTGAATETLQFFEDEVERLDGELGILSAEMLRFKLSNRNALPESVEYQRNRQAQLQQQALDWQRDISALKQRRENLVSLFEETGRVDTSQNRSPEQQQLERLRQELDSALTVYSPSNPRVRVLQTRVSVLESAVEAQLGIDDEEGQITTYELQLADMDEQISLLEQRRERNLVEVERIQQDLDDVPGNAIQLQELQRQYNNTQRLYDDFSARFAKAATGERVEALNKGQRITVVQQALVPSEPASPNRTQIALAGVGGGMVLGLAFVVLLELLNSAIRRQQDITKGMGVTPIATFPYMRTRSQALVRRTLIASVLLGICVGIPASVWALHTYYQPIDLLLEKVLEKLGLLDSIRQIREYLNSPS